MSLEKDKEIPLLKSTLSEILRISKEAEKQDDQISLEDGLDGRLLSQWRNIKRKAESLLV
jgi:hypothetical protein